MFAGGAQAASEPRIVNIYNFCRDNDYRATNSKAKLPEYRRRVFTLIELLVVIAIIAILTALLLQH